MRGLILGVLLALLPLLAGGAIPDHVLPLIAAKEAFYGLPTTLLREIVLEESSGRPWVDHDSGEGCGPTGMKMTTAALVWGQAISCTMLKDWDFALATSARYLTDPKLCGHRRYRGWGARVLCYRAGHARGSPAWSMARVPWRLYPKDWGTRWIMQRVEDNRLKGMLREHYGK